MTNPGSLTMGFAGVDPRQLAPSVGTTQVGITISAVPSSASYKLRARTRSSPLEGFKITGDISATASRPLGLQLCQDQHYSNGQVQRERRRNRRPRRMARGLYEGIPLDEPRHAAEDSQIFRQPTAARAPAAHQDDDYEIETSDQQNHHQGRRNRRPKRRAREIYGELQRTSHVTQPYNRQPLDDTPLHEHLPPTRTATCQVRPHFKRLPPV